jgi:hypothetical protein
MIKRLIDMDKEIDRLLPNTRPLETFNTKQVAHTKMLATQLLNGHAAMDINTSRNAHDLGVAQTDGYYAPDKASQNIKTFVTQQSGPQHGGHLQGANSSERPLFCLTRFKRRIRRLKGPPLMHRSSVVRHAVA